MTTPRVTELSQTKKIVQAEQNTDPVLECVTRSLDDSNAEQTVTLFIGNKTTIADYMVIASGRSNRHVNAAADRLLRDLKKYGKKNVQVEGRPACDWVLVDLGNVVVHIFKPEVREFYDLEKMWNDTNDADENENEKDNVNETISETIGETVNKKN